MKIDYAKMYIREGNYNVTQIAEMLGMSQTGYSKYETGENDIPTVILIELARFYNTSINTIKTMTIPSFVEIHAFPR